MDFYNRIKNSIFSDWIMLLAIVILSMIGFMVYYSLSIVEGGMWPIVRQILLLLVGLLLFFWLSSYDYRNFKSVGWYLYILLILLLLVVLVAGKVEYGARRWLDLSVFSFQPAELGKCLFIFVMAKYFSEQGDGSGGKVLLNSLLLLVPVIILIALQPDLGTALVFVVIWVGMLFSSNVSRKYIWGLVISFFASLPVIWLLLRDYQKERILTFIDPNRDPYGSGYNVLQSQIAIGSGGWWGLGLGKGWQSQLHFLPVAYSDFAFSVLAEEFGFIGSVLVLFLWGTIIWKIWKIAFNSVDQYGYFVLVGIGSMLVFQIFVNMAMNLGLVPVTGIPLPLISSGGTSIISVFVLLGVVFSVKQKKIMFS